MNERTAKKKRKKAPSGPGLKHINEQLRGLAVPVDSLVLDPANVRVHPDRNMDAIKASLQRFGQRSPLVVQKQGMIVRAGNGRLQAARELGWEWVAAIVVDEDDVQATAYAIADNRSGELAEWDLPALHATLAALDFDLDELGFSTDEFDTLLDDLNTVTDDGGEPAQREPAAPLPTEADVTPEVTGGTVRGDVIPLGEHTLHCGDCLDVIKTLPDNSVDAIVTDPPYGLGFVWRGERGPDAEHGEQWDALPPGPEWAAECLRVCKPGAYLIAFGATNKIHHLTMALDLAGWEIRDQFNWLRWQSFPKHRTMLKGCAEPAVLARKPLDGVTLDDNAERWGTGFLNIDACRLDHDDPAWPGPQGQPQPRTLAKLHAENTLLHGAGSERSGIEYDNTQGRWPANVYYCAKVPPSGRVNNPHPTVKPVKLMRWLLQLVTPLGGTVLEPFAGSGTTLVAARGLDLSVIGVEINPEYCDIARARMERVDD